MTPQERKLIMKVAERVQQAEPQTKDTEAEQLINQRIGTHGDSVYLLTQAVIVQEYGLEQAQQRIQALEQDLEQARQPQAAGGSFLGGLFGGSTSGATGPGAVAAGPGSRPPPQADVPAPAGASRVGKTTPRQAATPQRGGGMGEFMRSAAAMAVGVAGGHMLFNGLQGMFGDDAADAVNSTDSAATADAANADATDDASAADIGGWGADQGVSEEALAGDGSQWDDSQPANDGSAWTGDTSAEDTTADSGFGNEGFDDGGFDDDWG